MAGTRSQYTASLFIMEYQGTVSAEPDTSYDQVYSTAHGLSDGDMMVNQTCRATSIMLSERGSRKITKFNDNVYTISPSISLQTASDIIAHYKYIDRSGYMLDGSLQITLRSGGQNEASFTLKETYEPASPDVSSVYSAGYKQYGDAAFGTVTEIYSPEQFGTDSSWATFVVSPSTWAHSYYGIKSDGTLWAWGKNNVGQLGLGTTYSFYTSAQQVGTATNWIDVVPGGYGDASFVFALNSGGQIYGAGEGSSGQLGIGDKTDKYTMTLITTSVTWSKVACGAYFAMGLKSDGTLWGWGANSNGQLGLGDTTTRNTMTQVGTSTNWVSISAGENHSAVINSSNKLYSTGLNTYGALGIGTTVSKTTIFTQVGSDTDWMNVNCGYYNGAGVKTGGELYRWGYNNGTHGDGSTVSSVYTATQIGTATDWTATVEFRGDNDIISSGVGFNTAKNYSIKADGTVFVSGYPVFFGNGTCTASTLYTVTEVAALAGATNINSLQVQTAFISGSKIYGYGLKYGIVDGWSAPSRPSEFQNIGSYGVKKIVSDYQMTFLVTTDNKLYGAGACSSNLGLGEDIDRTGKFVQIDGEWSDISTKVETTIGIKSDGTLWGWGENGSYQLGLNDKIDRYTPTQITATTWKKVANGQEHSAAIMSDGTLWTSGNGWYVGNGTSTTTHTVFTQIGSATNWMDVACGYYHTVAIQTDGTLWAWGDNYYGELGQGTSGFGSDLFEPTQIGTASNYTALAVSYYSTVVMDTDGKVWVTGYNADGELAVGDTADRDTLTAVTGTWSGIGAGNWNTFFIDSNNDIYASGFMDYWSGIDPDSDDYGDKTTPFKIYSFGELEAGQTPHVASGAYASLLYTTLPTATSGGLDYKVWPGQYVKIYLNSILRFSGIINDTQIKRAQNGIDTIFQEVSCTGLNGIPARRTINVGEAQGTTCSTIVSDVVDNYLAQEGIEAGRIDDGAILDEDWNDDVINIADILDGCAARSGYQWFIDENFKLQFYQDATVSACTYSIMDTGTFTDFADVVVEETIDNYANKLFCLGGNDYHGDLIWVTQGSMSQMNSQQLKCGGSGVYGIIHRDSAIVEHDYVLCAPGTDSNTIVLATFPINHQVPFAVGDMYWNLTENARGIITGYTVSGSDKTWTCENLAVLASQTSGNELECYVTPNEVAKNLLKRQSILPVIVSFKSFCNEFYPGEQLQVSLSAVSTSGYFCIDEVSIQEVEATYFQTQVKAILRDYNDFSTQKNPSYAEYFRGF